LPAQFGQQLSEQQRAFRGVDAQVVQEHDGNPSMCLRARHGTPRLRTERCGATAMRTLPTQPPTTPVNQAEAVLLVVIARRFDQPLSTMCTFGSLSSPPRASVPTTSSRVRSATAPWWILRHWRGHIVSYSFIRCFVRALSPTKSTAVVLVHPPARSWLHD
jgi:hypothetical protein